MGKMTKHQRRLRKAEKEREKQKLVEEVVARMKGIPAEMPRWWSRVKSKRKFAWGA